MAGSVAGLLLASPVVYDPGYHRGSGVPSLVLDVLLEVVDGRFLPDIVDRREASPCWSSILKVSEESVDAVLLGSTPGAQVNVLLDHELRELVLRELEVTLREAVFQAVHDRVGWCGCLLWAHR